MSNVLWCPHPVGFRFIMPKSGAGAVTSYRGSSEYRLGLMTEQQIVDLKSKLIDLYTTRYGVDLSRTREI